MMSRVNYDIALVLRDNMINLLPLTVQLEGLLNVQFNYS